ncbi:hypothetical protein F4778DRAFT_727415 [Xylariomycetidae sp. FL2044]|nr:hypothetical protein F4778DRAFT_727415 [Xylariomycetidae sp. FL2044]
MPAYQYEAPRGPPRKNDNEKWNPGQMIPRGGRIPYQKDKSETIVCHASYGSGTRDDPNIFWIYKPWFLRHTEIMEKYNGFIATQCKKLGFATVWVRKGIHDTYATRDTITNLLTGIQSGGADRHITIYMGKNPDTINVHGHIYASTALLGEYYNHRRQLVPVEVPVGLTPVRDLRPQVDELRPRNPRLWAWKEFMTKRPSEKYELARTSKW